MWTDEANRPSLDTDRTRDDTLGPWSQPEDEWSARRSQRSKVCRDGWRSLHSSTVAALLTATVFVVVLTGAASAHEHITRDEFEQAARDGKLKSTGLKLTDTARGIFKALVAANGDYSGGGVADGFFIRVITPYNWVAYRFKRACEEYRPQWTWYPRRSTLSGAVPRSICPLQCRHSIS